MNTDKCPLCKIELDISERHHCLKIGGVDVYWEAGTIIVEDKHGKRIAEYQPPKQLDNYTLKNHLKKK